VVEKFLEFKQQELSYTYWKKVKRRYEVEVMEWIDEENNRQKEQLRVTQWD